MEKFFKGLLTGIFSFGLGAVGCVLYVAFYGFMILVSLFVAIKILSWIL